MLRRRPARRRVPLVVFMLATVALGAPPAARSDLDPAPIPLPLPVILPAPLGESTSEAAPATSASASQSAAPAAAAKISVATTSLRVVVVSEINRIRRAHHLRALRVSSSLVRAGTEHARALATTGLFTHNWSDGRAFPTWIRAFYPSSGYRTWSAGENLLWSAPSLSAASAVRQWLDSPVHRHILLRPSWREVGVGTVHAIAAPGAYGGHDVDLAAAEFGTRTK